MEYLKMTTPTSSSDPTRLDYWKLIDRVACSGAVSPTAVIVLMRLLQHRNTETGQCNPGVQLLAKRLLPKHTAGSGYNKVHRAIGELKENGIVRVIQRYNNSAIYKFKFDWGADVNTSLNDDKSASIETMEGASIKTMDEPIETMEAASIETMKINNKGNNKDNEIIKEIASSENEIDKHIQKMRSEIAFNDSTSHNKLTETAANSHKVGLSKRATATDPAATFEMLWDLNPTGSKEYARSKFDRAIEFGNKPEDILAGFQNSDHSYSLPVYLQGGYWNE
jgi:hypothetical protein